MENFMIFIHNRFGGLLSGRKCVWDVNANVKLILILKSHGLLMGTRLR
jgi:hypothetical protein